MEAVIVCLAVLVLAGCGTTHYAARELPATLRASSVSGSGDIRLAGLSPMGGPSSAIAPEDLIEVTIETGLDGEEPLVHHGRVSESGALDVPMIGSLRVAGLEPSLAAEQIAAGAVSGGVYLRPQVSVRIEERATHTVTVLGAVTEPGQQQLVRNGCDVLTAVAAAGGFTEQAGTVVEVLRANQQPPAFAGTGGGPDGVMQASFAAPPLPGGDPQKVETIDLASAGRQAPDSLALGDRDVVVVREKQRRIVYVSGLVERPDQFELEPDQDLRVLDAIAMAGGISSPVADKVLVIRQTEQGSEPAVVKISISKAKSDGDENLLLRSGDLVSVESTASTVVLKTFQDLFRITMGVGGNLTLF